ncbi:MAG: branched-chain amino acid ABC transporter permease [Gammaproteobacteria bacterium]|nr:branched-chain amino acid ABC transporter permease [Gammaproteobacteria bacterium]
MRDKALILHIAVLAVLAGAQWVLPDYHHTNAARIMLLAVYAMGYNLLLGYTGLMSLGHAMFFAAGMYATGLSVYYWEFSAAAAFVFGIAGAALYALIFGSFALRTRGVSFLIVTMMFGQATYLTILYCNTVTLGDQGFTLAKHLPAYWAQPAVKYNLALAAFTVALLLCLAVVRSPFGRVLVAIRENEDRARLLGYNTYAYKLAALVFSAVLAGAAGGAYALVFSYVGASFAATLHSISPLLWSLLGGAGTTLGPLLGTGLMYYLIDLTSSITYAYLFVVGLVLLALVLFFPQGILGFVRGKFLPWLP